MYADSALHKDFIQLMPVNVFSSLMLFLEIHFKVSIHSIFTSCPRPSYPPSSSPPEQEKNWTSCQCHKIYINISKSSSTKKSVRKPEAEAPSWRPWPPALPQSLGPRQAGSSQLEFKHQ